MGQRLLPYPRCYNPLSIATEVFEKIDVLKAYPRFSLLLLLVLVLIGLVIFRMGRSAIVSIALNHEAMAYAIAYGKFLDENGAVSPPPVNTEERQVFLQSSNSQEEGRPAEYIFPILTEDEKWAFVPSDRSGAGVPVFVVVRSGLPAPFSLILSRNGDIRWNSDSNENIQQRFSMVVMSDGNLVDVPSHLPFKELGRFIRQLAGHVSG